MKKNSGIWCILLFGLFLSLDFACGKPVEETLDSKQLYWVDTVFYSMQDSIDEVMDSICDLRKDQYFKLASDSIRKIRIEEIEKLIGTDNQ